jgi:predicted  nucleic acid-binding Zn-ribbon protein
MKEFCTHCGKELENLENLNFCPFCGGNLKNQKEKNTKVDKISHSKEFKSSNTNYNFKRFEDFEDKYKEKEKEVLNTYTFEAHKKENQDYLKQTKKRGLIVFFVFIVTLYLTSGGRSNDFSTLINSILWIGFFIFILYVIFIFVTMFLHGNSKEFYQEELEKKIKDSILNNYKKNLMILNYIPNDLNYEVISKIEAYDTKSFANAENDLIYKAYSLKADGIINFQQDSNTESIVRTKKVYDPAMINKPREVETINTTTYKVIGMAIKVL